MQVIKGLENIHHNGQSGISVALGNFDGLHLGHRAVINGALSSGYPAYVVSFVPHTREFLFNEAPENLLTDRDNELLLSEMGVDCYLCLDFSKLYSLSPAAFLELLLQFLPIKHISVGFNYSFGKGGTGGKELLANFCKKNQISLYVAEPVEIDGKTVSSTAIRQLISAGCVEKASGMLGKNFFYTLKVTEGDKRGRTIGFPTINQVFPDGFVLPRFGVYSSLCTIDGKIYPSITNVGIRPTYRTKRAISETHILDFSKDLYGKNIKIELLSFLRGEKRFQSLEDLKNGISADLFLRNNQL